MAKEDLIAFMTSQLGLDSAQINDDTLLFSDGFLDSMSLVELVTYIQKATGVEFGMSGINMENLDSINRIMTFVGAKLSQGTTLG